MAELGGVELDGFVRSAQRAGRPRAVEVVTPVQALRHLVGVLAGLPGPAACPRLRAGGEIHLRHGVRPDGAADIPAFDDDRARPDELALLGHQLRAHRRNSGDRADGLRHRSRANLVAHVDAIEPHHGRLGVGADDDVCGRHGSRDRLGVGEVYASVQRGHRSGPVHRAGVQVPAAEAAGEQPRCAGLTRARRTVQRDYAVEGAGAVLGHPSRVAITRPPGSIRLLCTAPPAHRG